MNIGKTVNKAKVPSGECKSYSYGKGRSRSLWLMSVREWNSDSTSGGILAGIMQGAGAPTHHIKFMCSSIRVVDVAGTNCMDMPYDTHQL